MVTGTYVQTFALSRRTFDRSVHPVDVQSLGKQHECQSGRLYPELRSELLIVRQASNLLARTTWMCSLQ